MVILFKHTYLFSLYIKRFSLFNIVFVLSSVLRFLFTVRCLVVIVYSFTLTVLWLLFVLFTVMCYLSSAYCLLLPLLIDFCLLFIFSCLLYESYIFLVYFYSFTAFSFLFVLYFPRKVDIYADRYYRILTDVTECYPDQFCDR